jgi:hypothetical protein
MTATVYSGWQVQTRLGSGLNALTGSSLSGPKLDGNQRITTRYTTGVSSVGNCGQRANYALIEGKITVSGTVERFYTGSGILEYVRGTNETGSYGYFNLAIYPNGDVSGQPFTAISDVKITDYTNTTRPGAALMSESWDFIGLRMYTGSLP